MAVYGSGLYGAGLYGYGSTSSSFTQVTTTTLYGSRLYENIVLKHTPTATFGPYASATRTINDLTNKQYLTASFVDTASFSSQIPFFALTSELYTFDINASNKIVIKENSSSFSKALGSGKFASGDERSDFSIEFLLSKNYNISSNNDFAKFGINNGQHVVGISYSDKANEFYLNVYSQDGYIRFRSVVFAGQSKLSKHFVINFKKGVPEMYINTIRANILINNLTNQIFIANKTLERTVAEFSCATNNEHLLISMISWYNYSLPERLIQIHYDALFNIGDFKSYISSLGSPLLYERIPYSQKIARNDGNSQDFSGTNFNNTNNGIYIKPTNTPNFVPYGINQSYLDKVFYAGGTGVASTGGFSFRSEDFTNFLDTKSLYIAFSGIGTGRYTKENVLFSLEATSVGDIYVAIDSVSSKIHIGIDSSSILSTMSSSISKSASTAVVISSQDSVFTVSYDDGSDSASYDFGTEINYDGCVAYLFNKYYSSSATDGAVTGGNSEINFDYSYVGQEGTTIVSLSNSILNAASTVTWGTTQKIQGVAMIDLTIPNKKQNYFYVNDSSDSIKYLLYIDGASSVITSQSIINIPITASHAYLYASLTNYWNSSVYDIDKNIYIKDLALYNFGSASYMGGGYPAVLEVSNGIINDPDNYLNIFKQNNIGFIQSASNIIKISKPESYFENIGQIDFLIAIPETLSSSAQYLIDSPAASMTLTSSSNYYTLNFSGMTASINGVTSTSGVTRLLQRQHYFIQVTLNTSVASNSYIYMLSASNGNLPFTHSFDRISVFPIGTQNSQDRYAQIFGRRTVSVSDNHQNYLRVESLPDNYLLLNKTWQVYST
jgi:hypothetical protein